MYYHFRNNTINMSFENLPSSYLKRLGRKLEENLTFIGGEENGKNQTTSNNIMVFNNEEFGNVRTTLIDGEVWFVGKDVAEALGYSNTRTALQAHVDGEDKTSVLFQDSGSNYKSKTTLINESGLYGLILCSKLTSAKRFKHWVTNEVLPSIRNNGGYIAGQESMGDEELLAKALLVAQSKIEEREKKIAEQQENIKRMKPKEIFADAVATSKASILIGDLAKLICQNGHKIGQNRLFDWMRENGYLIRSGSSRNMPTQKAMEMKLFEVKESTVNNPDGSVRVTRTTKVTGKGQIYFINKFIEKGEETL